MSVTPAAIQIFVLVRNSITAVESPRPNEATKHLRRSPPRSPLHPAILCGAGRSTTMPTQPATETRHWRWLQQGSFPRRRRRSPPVWTTQPAARHRIAAPSFPACHYDRPAANRIPDASSRLRPAHTRHARPRQQGQLHDPPLLDYGTINPRPVNRRLPLCLIHEPMVLPLTTAGPDGNFERLLCTGTET